jgi:hypothetical protein
VTSTYEGLLEKQWQVIYLNQFAIAIVCPLCGTLVALGVSWDQRHEHKAAHVQFHAMLDSQLYLYNVPTPKGE